MIINVTQFLLFLKHAHAYGSSGQMRGAVDKLIIAYVGRRIGYAPNKWNNVLARSGNSRRALRRTNPDTLWASEEKKKERNFGGEGGKKLATQSERQREQEIIFVKVGATWCVVVIRDQSDMTSATDVNDKRLPDWTHTFLLDPTSNRFCRDLVKIDKQLVN